MTTSPLTEPLRETVRVFDRPGTPMTTTEVADRLDVGRRSTYERLERLVERNALETKKVGASGRVWWRTTGDGSVEANSDVRPENPSSILDVLDRTAVGVFVFDEDRRVTQVNRRASDLLGHTREDLLGEYVWDVLDPGSKGQSALDAAAAHRDPVSFEAYDEPSETWFETDVYSTSTGLSVFFRDVTQRKARERELERNREQLRALNDLHDVVRSITREVIDQSTREEIERAVCERLAATDTYRFAWTGEVDVATQTVTTRVEVGADDYLEGVTISVDPEDERSRGPTGRAILQREIQTAQDIRADERHDPWRRRVEEHDFRSSAAIPIVHGGTLYGVLNVYADRPNAFEGREREVIGQLGEVIGHAIAATERKRALMSDEAVELEFRVRDVVGDLGGALSADDRITLDHAIPLGDEEYLVYGSVNPGAREGLEALVAQIPHWSSVSVRTDADRSRFELHLSEPPVLSTVAEVGGSIESAVIEDGDFHMTLHLAPGGDVRRAIEAVEATYSTVELLKQRQVTRHGGPADVVHHALVADLTDRQRAALEAAYYAGFYDWPRGSSGEAVADSLGISSATFHQHLRTAQRKVFESILAPGQAE